MKWCGIITSVFVLNHTIMWKKWAGFSFFEYNSLNQWVIVFQINMHHNKISARHWPISQIDRIYHISFFTEQLFVSFAKIIVSKETKLYKFFLFIHWIISTNQTEISMFWALSILTVYYLQLNYNIWRQYPTSLV